MEGTLWAFLPALIAIVLALITKQVYISLFLGVFVGGLMYTGGDPLNGLFTVFNVMSEKVGANVPIIVFLVVLGIFVVLMQKSGGAKAYGNWATRKIKTKGGALAATAGLGCLIFVDDYFNCLTVGSVMRPVTDKFKVSRSKLSYIIDATAAPICIIAPISSWAAAVAGELEGDGLMVFISTIPFNVYALLTIVMVFALCFLKFDFGKMKRHEKMAEKTGDLFGGVENDFIEEKEVVANPKGKVRHLLIPVITLIVCCIGGMIYTGFFYNWGSSLELEIAQSNIANIVSNSNGTFITLKNTEGIIAALEEAGVSLVSGIEGIDCGYLINSLGQIELFVANPVQIAGGELAVITAELQAAGITSVPQSANVIEAFSNCDAGMSLAIGSTVALVLVSIYYICTKAVSFKEITGSFVDGFKAMVPAILILTFAWSISGIMGAKGGYLDASGFVENNLNAETFPVWIFPFIFFVLASGIAFSTGTSWGTFGVLIPLATIILGKSGTLAILTVSATLGGAVFGDHVSPISDTTILASAGAQCNHVEHVNTQLPYAGLVAAIAAVSYLIAGVCATVMGSVLTCVIMWVATLAIFAGIVVLIKYLNKKKEAKEQLLEVEKTE